VAARFILTTAVFTNQLIENSDLSFHKKWIIQNLNQLTVKKTVLTSDKENTILSKSINELLTWLIIGFIIESTLLQKTNVETIQMNYCKHTFFPAINNKLHTQLKTISNLTYMLGILVDN